MDGDDALPRTESTSAATPATRDRGSGRSEALILASWTLIGGFFMTALLHLGADLWGGARGPVVFGALIVLVMLGNFTRARARTTRPRHFGLAEAVAALWLGMGGGIAAQALGNDSGNGGALGHRGDRGCCAHRPAVRLLGVAGRTRPVNGGRPVR
ncbi:hypothetical protein [Kocuria oceani]|uniref:Uncharacterized protein n=1 Tax=Kocuria oceani TaxID=988827 RepID=A0ABV9TM24_9MICC|nr:hypothetical protein [Kocuria oceani]